MENKSYVPNHKPEIIYIYIDIIIYINNKNTIFTIVIFPNISHQPKG